MAARLLPRKGGCACWGAAGRVSRLVVSRFVWKGGCSQSVGHGPPCGKSLVRALCTSRGPGKSSRQPQQGHPDTSKGQGVPGAAPSKAGGATGDTRAAGRDILRRLQASVRAAHRMHRSVLPIAPGLADSVTEVARSVRHAARRVVDRQWWQPSAQPSAKGQPPIAGDRLPIPIAPGAATVTFQGAGLLLVYEIGVAKYVAEQFEPPAMVSGASGGALVAALLACDVDMEQAFTLNNHMVSVSGNRVLGPFVYGLHDLAQHLQHLFPDDATVRQRCNDRLVVSLTHVPLMRNKLVHRYDGGKQELLRVVLSSMNLPLFLFPLKPLDGEYHIDGGLTDNSPRLTRASVTVSPTDDTADIRPDTVAPALPRKHFFVPAPPQTMREFFDRGYSDAHAQRQLWLDRGFKPKT